MLNKNRPFHLVGECVQSDFSPFETHPSHPTLKASCA